MHSKTLFAPETHHLPVEQYIAHIISVNNYKDNHQSTTGDQPLQLPDLQDISTTNLDTSLPPVKDTQSSYKSEDDSNSTTHSTFSTTITSSMQLRPRLLISYNEAFLSKKNMDAEKSDKWTLHPCHYCQNRHRWRQRQIKVRYDIQITCDNQKEL